MTRKMMRSLGLGMFAVFSATIVSFLSFISVELAVAVFALSSVAFIVMVERTRRANWEQAVDFKFKHMNQKHDVLSREVERQGRALDNAAYQNARKDAVSFDAVKQDLPMADAKPFRPKPSKLMKVVNAKKPANLPKDEILARISPEIKVIEDSDSLSDMVVEELMGHALRNKRVDVFMQPVMRLPQRQRKFYEVFSRVRAKPGVYIPAARYLGIATKNGQIKDIDALVLTQCLGIAAQCAAMQDAPSFFINITANTLKNKKFMGRLLAFLSKNRGLASRLVFEMRQKEFRDLPIPVLQIVSGLARLGCSFSLDHVQDLHEDITDLQRFNVRFVKADAQMFIKASESDREYKALMKAKRVLEGNGIGLIAEKIENEDMMRGLLDYDLRYGQGYLFGRPSLQDTYEPELRVRHG